MSNIEVNEDFRSLTLKRYFANLSNTQDGITVKVFDGVMPTYQELEAFQQTVGVHADGWTIPSALLAELTGTGGYTELFTIQYNNFTNRRQTTKTSVDFFFAQRSESAFGLTSTPTPGTWFWCYQHNDNSPGPIAYWNLFGSVGLVDSGADMELIDNNFDNTRQYKLNDISMVFNIQTTTPTPPAG